MEPKTGRHFTTATPNRSGAELRIGGHVVEPYPAASTIHLMMDNINIHTRKSLTDYFGEQKGGTLGTGSPCTTPQNTATGSIKLKIELSCTRGNVWANGGFQI